jgi:hypothetical protein
MEYFKKGRWSSAEWLFQKSALSLSLLRKRLLRKAEERLGDRARLAFEGLAFCQAF